MDSDVARRLLRLNRDFYTALADPFARTRRRPQPGFGRLLEHLPQPCSAFLDVGCGEGRFGRFLLARNPHIDYYGIDFSEDLLEHARSSLPSGTFYQRDLSSSGALSGLGSYPGMASLAVLQHIPGWSNRLRLMRDMGSHLQEEGRLFLSTWQFLDSERQRRKIVGWKEVGLEPAAVEDGDHLLTWRSGGFGLRYAAFIDLDAVKRLAREAGLRLIAHFRSDGREGNLNLYTILGHAS